MRDESDEVTKRRGRTNGRTDERTDWSIMVDMSFDCFDCQRGQWTVDSDRKTISFVENKKTLLIFFCIGLFCCELTFFRYLITIHARLSARHLGLYIHCTLCT
jgi:hypothetical protein